MYVVYVVLPLVALLIFGYFALVGWAIGEVSKIERYRERTYQDD